jgi:hypothetical protein
MPSMDFVSDNTKLRRTSLSDHLALIRLEPQPAVMLSIDQGESRVQFLAGSSHTCIAME